MKHNCDVIRDLMPLCVDNAASEASRRMLADHLAECRECAEAYNEMKTELPQEALEHPAFDAEMKLLQKAQLRRKYRSVFIGVLIGVLVVVGLGYFIYKNIFFFDYELPVDQFDIQLSRRENGDIIQTATQYIDRSVAWGVYTRPSIGQLVMSARSNPFNATVPEERKTYIARLDNLFWVEGEGLFMIKMVHDEELDCYYLENIVVEEVWIAQERHSPGTHDADRLIYQRGDDISMASAELEAMFVNEDASHGTRQEHWERWLERYNR